MSLPTTPTTDRRPPAAGDEPRLCAWIRAEYREMPGMNLTLPQAARLFGLELAICEQVLTLLVDLGDLETDGVRFALSDAPGTVRAREAA
jgi:hypothetical protein